MHVIDKKKVFLFQVWSFKRGGFQKSTLHLSFEYFPRELTILKNKGKKMFLESTIKQITLPALWQ